MVAVALRCQLVGVLLMLSSCRGYGVRIMSGGCQLSAIGCASCRGIAAHVGRLVAFLVALRGVGWLSVGRGCCCHHVGRFSVVLSHLVGVSVASDGVPQMAGGCRGHLVRIGCRCSSIGCRCSSLSVGRGCREGAPHVTTGSPTVGRRPTQQCGGGLLRG